MEAVPAQLTLSLDRGYGLILTAQDELGLSRTPSHPNSVSRPRTFPQRGLTAN